MYLKQTINKILLSSRIQALKIKKEKYAHFDKNESLIFKYQIKQFNKTWSYATKNIKFYSEYSIKYKLPNKIEALIELNQFPIINKDQLINFFSSKENKFYLKNQIKTGGSTGKPASFPFNSQDQKSSYLRSYLGRSRLGINPFDSTALIWGHSHLFEKNLIGRYKYFLRKFKDLQLNIIRLSAYNMSNESVDNYIKIIKTQNIKFLIGYTSCIVKIANRLIELNNNHVFTNLKSIVVTAENVDKIDIKLIENVFKINCDIEYGTAEAGVLGYSDDCSKKINFFWDDYIYQKNQDNNLIITSIYDRYFPLIRYDTGDIIKNHYSQDSLLFTNQIIGRSNDNLEIEVNSKKIIVHSELFTHILKSIDDVKDFLIFQKNQNIKINYVSNNKKGDIGEVFFKKLEKEYSNFNKNYFTFINVPELKKFSSLSGKKKWIIIEK